MKKISLQWKLTLLTTGLITILCGCLTFFLYKNGVYYFDTLQEGENGQAKADALLSLYNKKTRNLRITNALGDNRVRAGSMIVVNLNLGDIKVKNFMLVEKCRHTYNDGEHRMDLTLRGGEFID